MSNNPKHKNILLPCFIVATLIILGTLIGMVLLTVINGKKEPVYQYVSLTEEASARAYIWLNQIDDMPLSYADVKDIMGDIRLTLVLTPTGEKNRYIRSVADDIFADCQAQARNGLEKAYREVVRYRFASAGYGAELTDDTLDAMMQEVYGVSVQEYLTACEIQLLPTWEELTEQYAGEIENE